jgi:hypothetical protein
MKAFSNSQNSSWFRKMIASVILAAFFCSIVTPAGAQLLPAPGTPVALSPAFTPLLMKAVKVHPENPFQFDFIVEPGSTKLSAEELKDQSQKLIRYFLASLTTPENDLWVNLSPYEEDRIIPESFGVTEMGRDLLAQDYLLKQITATLIYPEGELGKKFWDRIYKKAFEKYGTTKIPVNTFNKVWIVPQKAVVYENGPTAYVSETKLKVMLEEDYVALDQDSVSASTGKSDTDEESVPTDRDDVNEMGAQIVREILLPELEKEVNTGTHFAPLRQVYNSLILANWYKKRMKDSILAQIYNDKNKVAGVGFDDKQDAQKIYDQYVEAFKKGVYNYLKEDYDSPSKQRIVRKYFSGGFALNEVDGVSEFRTGQPPIVEASSSSAIQVTANFDFERNGEQKAAFTGGTNQAAQKTASTSSSAVTHIEAVYGEGNIVDFFVSPEMNDRFIEAKIDPQGLLNEVINDIVSDPDKTIKMSTRLTNNLKRNDAGISPIGVVAVYPDTVAANLPAETYKKLLKAQILKQIGDYRTLREKYNGQTAPYSLTDYYRANFSPREILTIVAAVLKSQGTLPADIENFFLIRRGETLTFDQKDIGDFWRFTYEDSKTMSVKTQITLFKVLMSLELNQTAPDVQKIAIVQKRLEEVTQVQAQIDADVKEFQDLYSKTQFQQGVPWAELIIIIERVAKLDPNLGIAQEQLKFLREKLALEQKQSSRLEELRSEFKAKAQAPVYALIDDILIGLSKDPDDRLRAFVVFEALVDRPELNLEQISILRVIVSNLSGINFSTAQTISKKLTKRFRETLIDSVFNKVAFPPEERATARDIYLASFSLSSSERTAMLSSELSAVNPDFFAAAEAEFKKQSQRLDDLEINFIYHALAGVEIKDLVDEAIDPRTPEAARRKYENLEGALAGVADAKARLLRTQEYFLATYGTLFTIPFDEQTPLTARPINSETGTPAKLYSVNQLDRIVERLILVDQALARLPSHMTRNSLTLQRFTLFREYRDSFSLDGHTARNNGVNLDLESPQIIENLYHELGHSLHGPLNFLKNFAAYVDYKQMEVFHDQHPLVGFFAQVNSKEDMGKYVWGILNSFYRSKLSMWNEFNINAGISDFSNPVTVRVAQIANADRFYGQNDRQDKPKLGVDYMFEISGLDSANGTRLLRDNFQEFFSEHVKLYLLDPEFSKKTDRVMYDLLKAIIGTPEPLPDVLRDLKTATRLVPAASTAVVEKTSPAVKTASAPTIEAVNIQDVGGINLSADQTVLEIRGNGQPIQFNFDTNQLQNLRFDGLVPVIINIAPVINLPLFLSGKTTPSLENQISKLN